ncbi:hypothetical protein [Profundibacter sp.]|uniref:hypothetical protein n=1 Tax=Profundibacter sp. TaxID=3101071 RepID=UPI003D117C35
MPSTGNRYRAAKTIAAIFGVLLVSGCMTAGGGSAPSKPAKPYATTGQAFGQFQKICLKSPFNTSRNIAAFRASPVFVPEENTFAVEGIKITSFKHTTVAMSGSVSDLTGSRHCTITYTPAGDQEKEALIAATLMNAVAGIKTRPAGIRGGGFVFYKYKSGHLAVQVDHKSGSISLSTVKQ